MRVSNSGKRIYYLWLNLCTSNSTIYAISNLLQKVILYPEPENIIAPSYFVVIDFQRPQLPFEIKDLIVPLYPLAGDMILINGDNEEL